MLFKDSKSLKKEKTMCICRGLEIKWNINKPTYTQNIIVPYNKTATVYLYTYTAKLIFFYLKTNFSCSYWKYLKNTLGSMNKL